MIDCSDICLKYKVGKPHGIGRYASGQKYCSKCAVFMKWDGSHCPCCRNQLKVKPRSLKHKIKFREAMKIGK